MFTTQMTRRFRSLIVVLMCFYFVLSNVPAQAKFSRNAFTIDAERGMFTDTQYGFSFTYPAEWQATLPINRDDQPDPMVIRRRVALRPPNQKLTEIRVDVWENTESLALQQWFDKYIHPLYSSNATLLHSPDISIAGAPGILVYEQAHSQSQGRMTALTVFNRSIISVDYYTNDGGGKQLVFLDIVRSLGAINRSSIQAVHQVALPNAPLLSPSDATIQVQSCCGWTDPNTNTYPCSGGNCTWWAKYKRPDVANTWGNALSWRDWARHDGFSVGYTARVGAIAVWQPNIAFGNGWYSGSVGHVAYVTAVNNNGTFVVSSMSWNDGCTKGDRGVSTFTARETGNENVTFIYERVVSPKMDINTPGDGQPVAGHFLIGGWAIHEAAASGAGVDAVHIYFDGGAGTGARGVVSTYGIRRDDVAAVFGDRYRYSGYHFELESSELSIGQHTIYVYAHSTVTDQWQLMTRTFTVANTPPNVPTQATPTNGATVSGPTVQFAWQDPGDPDNRPNNYRDYTTEVKNSAGQIVAQMPWTVTTAWSANLADGAYTWHIQAGDGAQGSAWSTDWSFTVSSTITKPSNLAGEATAGGIRLTWQDNATNETGYRIYRWRGEDLTWPMIGEVAGTEFTDTQVVCGVTYFYLVSAFNSSSESEREGWIAVSVSGCPSLGAPSNFQVSSADTHNLTLTWQDNASNEQGFRIYRWNGVDWPLYATLGPDVTSYTDINLLCAEGFSYRVAAFNAAGEAIMAGWLDGFTTACPTISPAPTGLQVTLVTQSGVKLSWQDHAATETSFFIYRRPAADTGAEFPRIGLVGANITVFQDTGLRCNTTYLYQVSAWNDAGESIRTAAVPGATGPCDSAQDRSVVYIPMIRK